MTAAHRVDNDGLKLAVVEDGAGPDVLLVHGLGSAAEMWDDVVADLADRFRCCRLDLRGHGASDRADRYLQSGYASDVAAALNHIGRPTVAVGHSLGGSAIAGVASEGHPLLHAVYIMDSTLVRRPGAQSTMTGVFPRIAEMLHEYQAAGRPVDDYVAWLASQAYPGGVTVGEAFTPERLWGRAESLSLVDVGALEATIAGYPDEQPRTPAFAVPTRVAGADPALGGSFTDGQLAGVLEHTPGLEFRRFEGVGHPMVMVQGFREPFVADLVEFLDRVSGGPLPRRHTVRSHD